MNTPTILRLNKIGDPSLGYISVVENNENIPFKIKRVYWTYFTPNHVKRGAHAHKELQQFIVAVSGIIEFVLIDSLGKKEKFVLDNPDIGLYIPNGYWREIKFSHNAVLLCLASEKYDEADYIRSYEDFLNLDNVTYSKFSEEFLDLSWFWLKKKNIKELTNTPNFTKKQQREWFENLDNMNDYIIKGVLFNNSKIGVVGLKNITLKSGEYWGYIGEEDYWGRGIGKKMITYIITISKDLKLEYIYLNVLKNNKRAINLYESMGFKFSENESTENKLFFKLHIKGLL